MKMDRLAHDIVWELAEVYITSRVQIVHQLRNLRITNKASPTNHQCIPTLRPFVLKMWYKPLSAPGLIVT